MQLKSFHSRQHICKWHLLNDGHFIQDLPCSPYLTHWGRVTHTCVSNITIISSDNGLSPGRRQAIIWTNAGILLIGSLGTDFSEIWIKIQIFSLKKMRLKMSSAKWCPFRLSLNVLMCSSLSGHRPTYWDWTLDEIMPTNALTSDVIYCRPLSWTWKSLPGATT